MYGSETMALTIRREVDLKVEELDAKIVSGSYSGKVEMVWRFGEER